METEIPPDVIAGRRVVENAIAAAGGLALWKSIETLYVTSRLGGIVWSTKGVTVPQEGPKAAFKPHSG